MVRFRDWRRSLALKFGIHISASTDLKRLRALMSDLRPQVLLPPLTRIGPQSDGGYLLPDDLDGVDGCFSPGVSTECGFDLEIASRGMVVFQADASVDEPPVQHSNFRFIKKFIEPVAGHNSIVLEQWVSQCAPGKSELLLQMDIEGAEWTVLLSTPEDVLKKFRIIVVEFHDLHLLFNSHVFNMMESVMRKLLGQFVVAHIHPNNTSKVSYVGDVIVPSIMEITFLRRDRLVETSAGQLQFPHPLDWICDPRKPDIELPKCWR